MLSRRLSDWLWKYDCQFLLSCRQNSGDLNDFALFSGTHSVVFLFPPWDHCISTPTNNSLLWTNSLKALPKSYFFSQVSHLHSDESLRGPATSCRSFHLFLWQIKILKSRWGVSICYANLRSVHRPLIHDLWKQLTFSWSCLPFFSQNRHTAQTQSVF